jgi:hypothetical protein
MLGIVDNGHRNYYPNLIMRRLIFLVSILAFLGCSVLGQQPDWYLKVKELKILSSNYLDVVRVFDLPTNSTRSKDFKGEVLPIDSDEGTWLIYFTRGNMCSIGSRIGQPTWKVPEMTVRGISLIPASTKPILLDQLPFSISEFELFAYNPNNSFYRRFDEGVVIEMGEKNFVKRITFVPPNSTDYLKCPLSKVQ